MKYSITTSTNLASTEAPSTILLLKDIGPNRSQLLQVSDDRDPVRRLVVSTDLFRFPALHNLHAALAEMHASSPTELVGSLNVSSAVVYE